MTSQTPGAAAAFQAIFHKSDQLDEPSIAYLLSQETGRLATVAADGAPQNNPVGHAWNPVLGTVDIRGYQMAASRKWRNIATNPNVSYLVDDIPSRDPWRVRFLEIRGFAERVADEVANEDLSSEFIRIHPKRVLSFGVHAEGIPPH